MAMCHPERSGAESNFCERGGRAEHTEREKARGLCPKRDLLPDRCTLLKQMLLLIWKDKSNLFVDPIVAITPRFFIAPSELKKTSTTLRFAQDDT